MEKEIALITSHLQGIARGDRLLEDFVQIDIRKSEVDKFLRRLTDSLFPQYLSKSRQ
jgi:hypothetical protein